MIFARQARLEQVGAAIPRIVAGFGDGGSAIARKGQPDGGRQVLVERTDALVAAVDAAALRP